MSSLEAEFDSRFGPNAPGENDIAIRYDNVPLQDIELSNRIINALLRYNIKMTVGDLIRANGNLATIESLGTTGLNELNAKISQLLTTSHDQTMVLPSSPGAPLKALPEAVQKLPIDQLHLEERVHNALVDENITTIGELDNASSSVISAIRTFPPNALASINNAIIILHNSVTEKNEVDWFT